ncbi:MAG: SDR family oxidoreductase [Patescibacteria group bacterium]|nr:SDR family oxidoreductase [Patescibacteria group bacterium]
MQIKNPKTVFITGGTTGIGLATARLLLSQGYNVAIFSLTKPLPQDFEILCAMPNALVLQGSVTNQKQVEAALQKTIKKFGSLDVLINNAGISLHKSFRETTPIEWNLLIDVNVKGVLTVTKCALPYIQKQKLGIIINIASDSALHPIPYLPIYSLTKAAVLNFSQSLDHEIKPRIRSIAIIPGSTNTTLFKKSFPHRKALYQPEDVARVIADVIFGKHKPNKQGIVNPFKHVFDKIKSDHLCK